MKYIFSMIVGLFSLALATQFSFAAGAEDEAGPAPPPQAAPAIPPPALPSEPGLPGLEGGTAPGFGFPDPNLSTIPEPPPLTGLALTDAGTTPTTGIVGLQEKIDTYKFLFREDPEMDVVRERYTEEDASRIRENEIARFSEKYINPGQGAGQPQAGQSARAGAEWDFYFQQFHLYNRYVREKLLPDAEDLPDVTYSAENYLQERQDTKAGFDQGALALANQQSDQNLEFYDRLQTREDRRRAYYEWLADQQRELDEWAMIWSRRVNGWRWNVPGDQPVRVDDWYYGVNFASPDPKIILIEDHSYLLSAEPQKKVPPQQLNVISTNLTPYDIIDYNGQFKTPEMERLRGTAVQPPMATPVPGRLELVP